MTTLTRRSLITAGIAGAGLLVLGLRPLRAEELFSGVPIGEAPGDYGYKHGNYHYLYQAVFGELGHCSCGSGDCRVTDFRETLLGSPVGYDVIAYRHWLPLPADVWIPLPEQVPPELRTERAHICAYGNASSCTIPCAIINVAQG